MLLSIVTGTYNRLASLQAMVQSVRDQLPRHLSYEVVVVDGGSTDGTLDWCEQQPDIALIRHGALKGAINAFGEGAAAARGEYVVMANDDITFHPYSLLRALSHLEDHRTCGAVAFADNRSARMGHGVGYRVMPMWAIGADGRSTTVFYAQVGMFRRWLGDAVGWWGANDYFMKHARTYGGDNFLSAGIWGHGYTVDAVEGCTVEDGIAEDNLREYNHQYGKQDATQYYGRYPQGPQLLPYPDLPNPMRTRLRVLLMDIHEPRLPAATAKERGLAEALAEVSLLWHIDYVNEDWDLPAAVQAWRPHILLTQVSSTDRLTPAMLQAARAEHPSLVIVNWNGDAHERGLTDPAILDYLRECDLQTGVNLKVAPTYEAEGIPFAYWQIGIKDPGEALPEMPAHEVLFMGNAYNDDRLRLVEALRAIPADVGLYGSLPGSRGNTHYDFAAQRALYAACGVAVSDTYPNTEAFVSNRLFQALGAGAFVLQQHSPRLDEMTGLKAGVHYAEWQTVDDLPTAVAYWLDDQQTRARETIAKAGSAYAREHFSYPAQVRKLWRLLPT